MRLASFVGLALAIATCPRVALASGKFDGNLDLRANSDGVHMTLLSPYAFIDEKGLRWDVPSGAMVDGASIPRLAWSIIGGPFEGRYRNAAVVHDWFCDRRTRPWREVHRMFYDAMITGGVDLKTAKIMYLAVMWGGPRWDDQTVHNSLLRPIERPARLSEQARLQNSHIIGGPNIVLPKTEDRFNAMAAQVMTQDPSLDQIDALAEEDPANVATVAPRIANPLPNIFR